MDKLVITPRTKIYDLLEAFPQLEDTLIESAPQFKKLKNPVLRKTIARITTLSQAASIGGINVEELVNKLRDKAGQSGPVPIDDEQTTYITEQPDWYTPDVVVKSIDIREMLHEGEQPVHEVLSSIKKLEGNQVLKIVAPFLPAPLIDKATGLGYKHWINQAGPEEFLVFFSK
ncbi:MAG: DUF1858 domain-containing protein [Bacteroidales bacterium]